MTYRTFRIRQMTCMACGHPQRCKFVIIGDVETAPGCHSCGESTQWMSEIAMSPSHLTHNQRFMTGITEWIGTEHYDRGADAFIRRFQEIVRQLGPETAYRRYFNFGDNDIQQPEPFLKPAMDAASQVVIDSLLYGYEIDWSPEGVKRAKDAWEAMQDRVKSCTCGAFLSGHPHNPQCRAITGDEEAS